jgi:hypothetical protein
VPFFGGFPVLAEAFVTLFAIWFGAGYHWLVAARGISTREIFNRYFNFLLT